jgi:hypothetical protein
VAKGNAGEAIVRNDIDRRGFVVRLGQAVARNRWRCLAYCLLDTHFHLVLVTAEANLGDGMRWLASRHAQDVNFRHGRSGHLFGGRFYSVRLKSDEHLLAALVYVLVNPVRAGMTRSPADWPWSSCAATIGPARPPGFLDVEAVLELFGSDPSVSRLTIAAALDETLALDRRRQGSDP